MCEFSLLQLRGRSLCSTELLLLLNVSHKTALSRAAFASTACCLSAHSVKCCVAHMRHSAGAGPGSAACRRAPRRLSQCVFLCLCLSVCVYLFLCVCAIALCLWVRVSLCLHLRVRVVTCVHLYLFVSECVCVCVFEGVPLSKCFLSGFVHPCRSHVYIGLQFECSARHLGHMFIWALSNS